MEVVLVMVVVAVVVFAVIAPLRGVSERDESDRTRLADLQAARDAKYQEIRDAALDYRTGKLSEADWRSVDRQLRREAVELLHQLDELAPTPGDEPAADGRPA